MESSFGDRLRRHREQQGVALTTIADQTKIKLNLLEGLERDDVSQWPAGIFRRSYVRAYAQAVGLSPDAVVREFIDRYPDPAADASVLEAIARNADSGPRRRLPTRLTYLISSAIGKIPSLRSQSDQQAAPAAAAHPEHAPFDSPLIRLDLSASGDGDAVALMEASSGGLQPDPPDDAQMILSLETASGMPIPLSPGDREDPLLPTGATTATRRPAMPSASQADMRSVAQLCTSLGRAASAADVVAVLGAAAALLDAVGLILWTWDSSSSTLRPVLSHGYSDDLLVHVPPMSPDSDTAIGLAFREAETRIVHGDDLATGAVVAPLMTPGGCTGVLAAEFHDSGEQLDRVCAVVTILAAQLSMLVGQPPAPARAATA